MSENEPTFCKNSEWGREAREEGAVAFHSIGGEALVHLLVIPRKCESYLEEIDNLPEGVAKCIEAAQEAAEKVCVAESSCASGTKDGGDAGQEVFCLHAHVVGDRKMEII